MCLRALTLDDYKRWYADYRDAAERYAWYYQDLLALIDELVDTVPGVEEYLIQRCEEP